MRNTTFAIVNGKEILGGDIINARKMLTSEMDIEESSFANTPNDENNSFINAEALQTLIDKYALVALAKFEGIEVSDEDISNTIFELRNSYEDEAEWETALDDLGINDKNIRDVFCMDMMVDRLLQSHLEHFDEPDNQSAEDFYHQNIESMKLTDSYTFIEVEVSDASLLKTAAEILSKGDTAYVLKECKKNQLEAALNEEIPFQQLPEPLQEAFKNLEEHQIGSVPLEEGGIVLIKLLRKITGKTLSFEDALDGLIEYLNYQQQKDLLDELTSASLEKCDIQYLNTELLKDLK